ncbi:MAG: hypothetical protein GY794_14100 [bacterium]|nr:hypothetical protein [bacterium]
MTINIKTIGIVALSVALLAVSAPAEAKVTVKSEHYEITAPNNKIAIDARKRLERSAWLFEGLFGVAPPAGKVILEKEPANAQDLGAGPNIQGKAIAIPQRIDPNAPKNKGWTLNWFAEDPSKPANSDPLALKSKALTHEAAHLQFAELTNPKATEKMKTEFNGYGGFLPDWFDEAVAIFHEPDSLKTMRRKQLVGSAKDKLIPLAKLFTMSHPAVAGGTGGPQQIKLEIPADGSFDQAKINELIEQRKKEMLDAAQKNLQNSGDPMAVNMLYIQSLAVLEYMIDRGGQPFVRYAAEMQASGKTMDEVLSGWKKKRREILSLRRTVERRTTRTKKTVKRSGTLPAHLPAVKIAGIYVRPKEKVATMPLTVKAMQRDWLKWISRTYRNR